MILAVDSVARLYCIVRGPIPEPMHAQCPESASKASQADTQSTAAMNEDERVEKPNPFAVLAQLKKK